MRCVLCIIALYIICIMVYVLCIMYYACSIMWFWYYAMQLVETTPLNKISVPAFPDSRFSFPRLKISDSRFYAPTHDSRTT